MADSRDSTRSQYPPPQEYPPPYGAHEPQRSPTNQPPPSREGDRTAYPPPPDPSRQGQYPPPPDPSRQGQYPPPPAHYPPPGQWAGQPPPAGYGPPHYPYPYAPRPDLGQPPQPMQPDAYRLPPLPYGHPGYYPPPYHQQPAAPAPRQRTAIACKYCRKRKIRCSGYDASPDGRCANCLRFNQTCLFHPVSSQAAFVPASAVYGPNVGRAPVAGQAEGQGQNGQQQPMLYGAHGQPLGPVGPASQPPAYYPPPQGAYPYPPYHAPPHGQYPGHPPHYDHQQQSHPHPPQQQQQQQPASQPLPPQQPPAPQQAQQSSRAGSKRSVPDENPHNEDKNVAQSPHPNVRPRHNDYDGRASSSGGYEYQGQPTPTSPATSALSYQSYAPQNTGYANGTQSARSNNSPPAGHTPSSANSYNSPRTATADGKSPPPAQPGSAGSTGSSRSGMKVHEMLGNSNNMHAERRQPSDNEMLNKLDGKK